MHPLDDTIAAIASPPGGAARGIVRLSGLAVEICLEACFRGVADNVGVAVALPPPESLQPGGGSKTATPTYCLATSSPTNFPHILEGELHLPGIFSPLPCELYLWPAGRSYTGQEVAEFHTFGSPPLLEALLKTLCAAGARLAEPGEFTLRAFLSGRIDLTQAEAVLGVIDADDPRQLRTALGQLAGGLAGPLHQLRDELLELLAHLEAGFDFAEEDISFIATGQLERQLAAAAERVAELLEKMSSRNLAETATKAVLVGRPNAGKSSLFNALLDRSGALVSPTPGTTRDYLCAELDLDGVKCRLIDTAGIETDLLPSPFGRGIGDNSHLSLPNQRPRFARYPVGARKGAGGESCGENDIDSAAQSAAREQHRQAAICIICIDADSVPDDWERERIEQFDPASTLLALTKIDKVGQVSNLSLSKELAARQVGNRSYDFMATSSVTGEGIDLLRAELRQKILSLGNGGGDVVAGTAARCGESLRSAGERLRRARAFIAQSAGEEFVAGEIRLALEEIGRVAGAVYTDDVLNRIFSRFCVGK
jgi:tRNA modification GTPase